MRVLAIETSCDETGIAVVEGTCQGEALPFGKASPLFFRVHKNALLSQAALHAQYGGVYPNLAKREHEKNLPLLFEQFRDEKVDAVAVTKGPGLEPALWQGIVFAEKMAKERSLPLVPVNHMEGHLISSLVRHSNILQNVGMSGELRDVTLPVLALLISGGHTEFVLMRKWFKYEIIGETLDDAVGEAFDKVARMLGLSYPGGPEISRLAEQSRKANAESTGSLKLPRPMLNTNTCDVSFSGLKTAALYALRGKDLSEDEKKDFAREFEDAVTDVFVAKTRKALRETGAQTFVIGGGVAANKFIRESLQKLIDQDFSDVEFRLPELSITGDNAIMIAEAAPARRLSGLDDNAKEEVRAVGNLSIAS